MTNPLTKPDAATLEKVTHEAENGHGEPLAELLMNGLGFEERIMTLRKMEELNNQHIKADSSVPKLYISYGQEFSAWDLVPYLSPAIEHNQHISVRSRSPISSANRGAIFYESFNPVNLDRTLYWKESSHYLWTSTTGEGRKLPMKIKER